MRLVHFGALGVSVKGICPSVGLARAHCAGSWLGWVCRQCFFQARGTVGVPAWWRQPILQRLLSWVPSTCLLAFPLGLRREACCLPGRKVTLLVAWPWEGKRPPLVLPGHGEESDMAHGLPVNQGQSQ